MLQAPLNHLLVQITKKYQDITAGGIHIGTEKYNPEEYATLTATVHSVPRGTIDRRDYEGYSLADIYPGDTIIMRYTVVHNYLRQPAGDLPIYKNLLFYKGEEYWRCDIQNVFAVIRDGEILMRNGYVMGKVPDEAAPLIYIPNTLKAVSRGVHSEILYIGAPLIGKDPIDASPGDIMHYKPNIAEHYWLGKKPFIIVKQKYIYGIEKQLEVTN